MKDEKMWRREGPKALLEFLATATGEDHDAAVYDTKLEFDSSNMDAVRYIASVAMAKAGKAGADFDLVIPQDGSVCPYDVVPALDSMRSSYEMRKEKESSADFYFPDSSAYSDAVINALNRYNILLEDMTEEELKQVEDNAKKAQRSDSRYMFWHYYLPLAFAVFSFFLIVYKLTH